jgi:hypothetical protein
MSELHIALAGQLEEWLKKINIGDAAAKVNIHTTRKIDPENGVLSDLLSIQVDRQMERKDEKVIAEPS